MVVLGGSVGDEERDQLSLVPDAQSAAMSRRAVSRHERVCSGGVVFALDPAAHPAAHTRSGSR